MWSSCQSAFSVSALSSTSWTLITVNWAFRTLPSSSNLNCYYSVYANGLLVKPQWISNFNPSAISYSASDVVRFGGFTGKLAAIKIHSPGSLQVSTRKNHVFLFFLSKSSQRHGVLHRLVEPILALQTLQLVSGQLPAIPVAVNVQMILTLDVLFVLQESISTKENASLVQQEPTQMELFVQVKNFLRANPHFLSPRLPRKLRCLQ